MIRQVATASDGTALEIIQTAEGAQLIEDGDRDGIKHYPSPRAARQAAYDNLLARVTPTTPDGGFPPEGRCSPITWRTE